MTHLCVSKLTSIASDNGLSPGRRQAIIWNNAGILWIGPLGTNFSEILIEIQTFSLKKIRLKMSSAKCCSFRLGLNVLYHYFECIYVTHLTICARIAWWRHQMETFSALLALCVGDSPVTGEFPTQRPVTRSFDVFFDLGLNKRLSKQSWDWWSEIPSCPLWRHCNGSTWFSPQLITVKHKTEGVSLMKYYRYLFNRTVNEKVVG